MTKKEFKYLKTLWGTVEDILSRKRLTFEFKNGFVLFLDEEFNVTLTTYDMRILPETYDKIGSHFRMNSLDLEKLFNETTEMITELKLYITGIVEELIQLYK